MLSDLETAALVHREGSIDWCCFPRFDAEACFARLLGNPEHGRWLVAPEAQARGTRRYRAASLVLETEWETTEGACRVIDFMPPTGNGSPSIVRIVEGLAGYVAFRSELIIRFGYGRTAPSMSRVGDALVARAPHGALCLRTPAATRVVNRCAVSNFGVVRGQRVPLTLTWVPTCARLPTAGDPCGALGDTEKFWDSWSSRCSYGGPYREAVLRSLVVLKGLTYRATGGIVAAPTTSLPEWPGGVRNWDYRYCWLRDAALTLRALVECGYLTEAEQWRSWLVRTAADEPVDPQIMYGVGGERLLPERQAAWLPGFEDSRPVRIGNDAAGQLQLDVYGEVVDALYQARRRNLSGSGLAWGLGRQVLGLLEDRWREADNGIWEVRGANRHFTYSKAMAWVAFDRGIKMCEEFGLHGPVARWRVVRDEIHAQICREAWNDKLGSFTQSYGSDLLDASVLLLPVIGFLPAEDSRIRSTLTRAQQQLSRHGFMLRYDSGRSGDGMPEGEGAFLPCSFWLVDALAIDGRCEEATELFERLLEVRNDVGLLAEEYDPENRRLLGNFPQAFSHVALINSALNLAAAGAHCRVSAGQLPGPRPASTARLGSEPTGPSHSCLLA